MGGKESGKAREVSIEPGFQREPGRESGGLRKSKVFE